MDRFDCIVFEDPIIKSHVCFCAKPGPGFLCMVSFKKRKFSYILMILF
jgi:hypothetical protein